MCSVDEVRVTIRYTDERPDEEVYLRHFESKRIKEVSKKGAIAADTKITMCGVSVFDRSELERDWETINRHKDHVLLDRQKRIDKCLNETCDCMLAEDNGVLSTDKD